MDDLIIDWLKWGFKHSPTLIVGGLSVWLFMYLRSRFKNTETKCAELHTNDVPEIKSKLSTIIGQLSKITTYLATEFEVDHELFVVNSPRELSPLGESILSEIGGRKYVDNNIGPLMEVMEKQGFKSGFDVETFSAALIMEKFKDDGFVPVKNYIFQNPEYKYGEDKKLPLTMQLVVNIVGLYLRNKYFEKHPDLKKDL